jgi:hypothetical protein
MIYVVLRAQFKTLNSLNANVKTLGHYCCFWL